jgi:hypothetical protein
VAETAEVEVDPAVKEVVLDQMDQWTEMIERHRLGTGYRLSIGTDY